MRIVEILGRSEQGVTRPFICRGEDGLLYYVKGRHAGYEAMCREWVAGELARFIGLPIAPFVLAEVPENLINGSVIEDAVALGKGMAFASRQVLDTVELRWNEVAKDNIPIALRAQIFIFDWWVANTDRVLGDNGGNANLLWSDHESKLTVIDHNLAFSLATLPESLHKFCLDHIFGRDMLDGELDWLEGDLIVPSALARATWDLEKLWRSKPGLIKEIWAELPEVWQEGSPQFTQRKVETWLARVVESDFGDVAGSYVPDKSGDVDE